MFGQTAVDGLIQPGAANAKHPSPRRYMLQTYSEVLIDPAAEVFPDYSPADPLPEGLGVDVPVLGAKSPVKGGMRVINWEIGD